MDTIGTIFVFIVIFTALFGLGALVGSGEADLCPPTQKLITKKHKVYGKTVEVEKCVNKEEEKDDSSN